MAGVSCVQIHDPNDAISHHHNHRDRRFNHPRRSEPLTQITDSIPYWVHADDFDLYVSDTESPPAAVFAGDVSVSDSAIAASDGLDLLDGRSFFMDLPHQRIDQSQVTPPDDIEVDEVAELRPESGFGVIEGNYDVDSELGLESGGGFVVENVGDSDSEIDVSVDLNPNVYDERDDVDFYMERRPFRLESRGVESTRNDLRETEWGPDDDERNMWGTELNVEDDDDEEDDASVTVPVFCWDSLQLEDGGSTNEDFEWEEVDGGGAVVERMWGMNAT